MTKRPKCSCGRLRRDLAGEVAQLLFTAISLVLSAVGVALAFAGLIIALT